VKSAGTRASNTGVDAVEIVGPEPQGNISGAVDAELAELANQIRKVGGHAIITIGEHLIAAKKLAGHGNWHSWLEREFGWTDRKAQRYMAIAKAVASNPNASDLTHLNASFDVLCLLTDPSTPPEVIQDVAALDRKITGKDVTKAKAAHKRNLAPTLSKPKTANKPTRDPIDAIVDKMRGPLCDDKKWRAKPVIASVLKVAPTAVQEALDTLEAGKDYDTRARGDVIEFQFRRIEVADAKDLRIAELEAQVIQRDAEIAGLRDEVAELKAKLAASLETAH
jgi:Protein of unknown function (DUF3102)